MVSDTRAKIRNQETEQEYYSKVFRSFLVALNDYEKRWGDQRLVRELLASDCRTTVKMIELVIVARCFSWIVVQSKRV